MNEVMLTLLWLIVAQAIYRFLGMWIRVLFVRRLDGDEHEGLKLG